MVATTDIELDTDLARALRAAAHELAGAARSIVGASGILPHATATRRAHRAEEQIAWVASSWRALTAPARAQLGDVLAELRTLLVALNAHAAGEPADRQSLAESLTGLGRRVAQIATSSR